MRLGRCSRKRLLLADDEFGFPAEACISPLVLLRNRRSKHSRVAEHALLHVAVLAVVLNHLVAASRWAAYERMPYILLSKIWKRFF
jgi:hypothetical protein